MTSSGWSFSAVYFWIPKIAILFKCILIFFPPLYILILRRNIQEINNITHSQKEYKSHLMSFWNDIRCCTGKHFSQYILRKWSKLSMSFWMIVMSLLVWNLKEIICREYVSSYFVHFLNYVGINDNDITSLLVENEYIPIYFMNFKKLYKLFIAPLSITWHKISKSFTNGLCLSEKNNKWISDKAWRCHRIQKKGLKFVLTILLVSHF